MSNTEEVYAAIQIERELETEDLVLLSQVRKALNVEASKSLASRGSLPYVAKPSLSKPGATIAVGR